MDSLLRDQVEKRFAESDRLRGEAEKVVEDARPKALVTALREADELELADALKSAHRALASALFESGHVRVWCACWRRQRRTDGWFGEDFSELVSEGFIAVGAAAWTWRKPILSYIERSVRQHLDAQLASAVDPVSPCERYRRPFRAQCASYLRAGLDPADAGEELGDGRAGLQRSGAD